jgi:hypothetical protein
VTVDDSGLFAIALVGDSIVSVSSKHNQFDGTKGLPPVPPPAPFPLPYHDDFESYQNDTVPKYLSDFNGAFAVADDVTGEQELDRLLDTDTVKAKAPNKVLRQYVTTSPLNWGHFSGPVTFAGDATWAAPIAINVSARIPTAGSTARIAPPAEDAPYFSATLFWNRNSAAAALKLLPLNGSWAVECADGKSTLVNGHIPASIGPHDWHHISFGAAADTSLFGAVNSNILFSGVPAGGCTGRGFAALETGLHRADFDDLVLWRPKGRAPHGDAGSWVSSLPSLAGRLRTNFDGLVGVVIRAARASTVTHLARFAISADGNRCARASESLKQGHHNLSIWAIKQLPGGGNETTVIASTMVDMNGPRDELGFVYAPLSSAAALEAEGEYAIMSEERRGGDPFCDGDLLPPAAWNSSLATLVAGAWAFAAPSPAVKKWAPTDSYGPVSFKTAEGGAAYY